MIIIKIDGETMSHEDGKRCCGRPLEEKCEDNEEKNCKKEHGHGHDHGKNCGKDEAHHGGHQRGRCCRRRGQPRMMINGEEI